MASDSFRFIAFRDRDNRYIPLVAVLAVILAALWLVFGVLYQTSIVDGDSMNDTLLSGDRVLITKTYTVPARGDIVSSNVVVDEIPDRILKRVVAIPGDTVEVFGDTVEVNGAVATWSGVILGTNDKFHLEPYVIPQGYVYLMGDNRPDSLDSRFLGPVPISEVNGKVVAVLSPVTRIRRID
ncbi:MAG: signal peptidase I [Coriobacteriia bacterium]|nr:signal peptidase I [Coriobacteriia bacterium]MBN2822760.1 signal peptidase I [Coriobacteriia bacterium]